MELKWHDICIPLPFPRFSPSPGPYPLAIADDSYNNVMYILQYGTNTVHVLMLHIFNVYCSMCGQNQCIKWQVWEIWGIGQGPGYYFPIVLAVSVNIIHSHAYLPSYVRYLSLAKSSCCDNSGLHGPNRPPIEANPITIITNIYAEIDSE